MSVKFFLLVAITALTFPACQVVHVTQEQAEQQASSFWVGYVVRNADGSIIDSLNAHKLFIPASLTKLFWYPEWKSLTGDTTFSKTIIRLTDSSLVIQAPGNPLLSAERLAFLADSLLPFQSVHVEYLPYDQLRSWGTGWMYDDEPSAFQPYFSSVPVNFNSVQVIIKGDIGNPEISTQPYKLPVKIIPGSSTKISRKRDSDTILVSLGNGTDSIDYSRTLSLKNPERVFTQWLATTTGKEKVVWQQVSHFSQEGAVLKTLNHSFDSLSKSILFDSNNLTAEQVLRYLSLKEKGNGSFLDFYKGHGIPDSLGQLVDGSGLSRYNLLSPLAIDGVLKKEKNTLPFLLPGYSVQGTLSDRRLVEGKLQVVAKSGSMNSVQNLAGYFISDGKVTGSFVLMVNHNLQPKETRYEFERRQLTKWMRMLAY